MTKKRYFFKGYKVPVYVKTGICQTQSELKRENRGKTPQESGTMSKARGRDCKMTECKKKKKNKAKFF